MNPMRSRRFPSLALFLAAALAVSAAVLPAEEWTVDDIVLAQAGGGWTLSPDGKIAAWIESGVRKVGDEEKRASNLRLLDLAPAGAQPLELTRGNDTVSQPAFSPGGGHLAFLSTRPLPDAGKAEDGDDEGKSQLWMIPARGGEAYPVTRFDRDVLSFGWIDDDTLLVLAAESPAALERERKEKDDTAIVVDDAENQPPVRLFKVSRDGDEVRRLTDNRDWIDDVQVSLDGKRAVVTAQQSLSYQFDQRVPPHTYLLDLATGEQRRLFEGTNLLPHTVRWALDSSGFFFANEHTRHPLYRTATLTELYFYSLAAGRPEKVDLAWDRGLGGTYAPTPDGFVALLAEGVRSRPARYQRTGKGWRRQDLTGTHVQNVDTWALSRDGCTVLYQSSSATRPAQGWIARLEGTRLAGERQVTDLNPGFKDKPTGKVEVVRWKGARGEEVEGLLYYPLDWKEGEKRPLVLDIHGGPAAADTDSWSLGWGVPGILYRQRGAFTLQVNYHGSSGYGLDWVESIAGHYYELEIPDIEAGVDALIARGLVDPEKLGSAGWSNGGILTAELITRTQRYKAASVGAADVEWISDWANVDFGAAFDNYYLGVPPWENPQLYIDKSPFFRLTQVTTPTIVYTGTEDRNVPPHQSWSLFRALQQIGKAPTRLVLFPGEPHGLRKPAHQRRKIEEDLAWFDRHLFGKTPERLAAVQEGSPLAALLARTRAVRTEGALGRREGSALVPETVTFRGLEVGRFEVTRGQWAAFDPSYKVEPGTADLPATGITFEKAKEYAAWLAKATGKPYRLPTVEEAEKLAGSAGEEGNTLDRWAGYEPNPRDREEIRKALEAVPGEAPLLLPVGSLPGTGDPAVFDLDGNAAEWAVGKDGKGQAHGPSADRPTDPRTGLEPAPAYTGLRVVVGDPAA